MTTPRLVMHFVPDENVFDVVSAGDWHVYLIDDSEITFQHLRPPEAHFLYT